MMNMCVAGRLLHSLGKSMLESLSETPVVRQHAPQLMKIVQQELQVSLLHASAAAMVTQSPLQPACFMYVSLKGGKLQLQAQIS